ncbi:MAG: hypothetical protein EBS53_16170 [Bacteroidetes bacterium]|nr:hypothetical protein [Bacteroidota bacterium]
MKPWEKKNPKVKPGKLTPAQKQQAKARARSANRPYPNWVDNAAVASQKATRSKKKVIDPLK